MLPKKESNYFRDADLSNVVVKKYFIALNAEVDKLDINELVNASSSLNKLKTKMDDLDVHKFKIVSIDLKKIK